MNDAVLSTGDWLLIIGIYVALFLLASVLYGFLAVGTYRLALQRGLPKKDAVLAWLPYLNYLLLIKMADKEAHVPFRGNLVVTAIIAGLSFMGLFVIVFPVSAVPFLIGLVITVYAFYIVSRRYTKRSGLHTVLLCVTFGMSMPFQLYAFSKRTGDN